MYLSNNANSAAKRSVRTAPSSVQSQTSERQVRESVTGPDDRFELSQSGPIQPEAGKPYLANRASQRPIHLVFDKRAVAYFRTTGLQVELEQAQVLTPDGQRVPLDARVSPESKMGDNYAVAAGQKLPATAEPWQFRVPNMPTGVFGKPHGVLIYGNESGPGVGLKFLDSAGLPVSRNDAPVALDDFQGLRIDTKVFRKDRRATLGRLAAFSPPAGSAGPAQLDFIDSSFTNVTFRAPTEKSLHTVTQTFDQILGRMAEERTQTVDLESLKIFEDKFQANIAKALEGGGDVDGRALMLSTLNDPEALQAMQEVGGLGTTNLTPESLLARVGQKLLRASPLEIVVIPKDKSAVDCVSDGQDHPDALKSVGRARFMDKNPLFYRAQTGSDELPTQRLFVGEEILETEQGVRAVLMHELLHIFEQRFANAGELQQIQESFESAKEFQSLYGSSRDEYLTTVGEEFLSTHGNDGPAWVERQHPQLFNLLTELTRTSIHESVTSQSGESGLI